MKNVVSCIVLMNAMRVFAVSGEYRYECTAIGLEQGDVDKFRFNRNSSDQVTNFEFESLEGSCIVSDSMIQTLYTENRLEIMLDQMPSDNIYRTIVLNQTLPIKATIYYKTSSGEILTGYDYKCEMANILETPDLKLRSTGNC